MRKLYRKLCQSYSIARYVALLLIGLALAVPAFAQANSPGRTP